MINKIEFPLSLMFLQLHYTFKSNLLAINLE